MREGVGQGHPSWTSSSATLRSKDNLHRLCVDEDDLCVVFVASEEGLHVGKRMR